MVNVATFLPAWSRTHTACSAAAQSIPTKNSASGSDNPVAFLLVTRGGCQAEAREPTAEWSLTGALRRVLLSSLHGSGEAGGGSVMQALEGRPHRAVTPAS